MLENFKAPPISLKGGASSSLGQFRRSSAGIYLHPSPRMGRSVTNYAAPPAPTEESVIFTPGPMVEEREIFFT